MLQFDFAARVDQGLVRKTNQDVARVIPELRIGLVADGMGGHDDGDVASEAVASGLERSLVLLGGLGSDLETAPRKLRAAFRDANRQLANNQNARGTAKMGTTLVAIAFAHDHAFVGNVGDSRCYLFRKGTLECLTRDHSYAAHLQEMGATETSLGRDAADQWAHVLTRCLDGEDGLEPDIRVVKSEPQDIYLLCSDGLWGSARDDMVARTLARAHSSDEACRQLVGLAWAGGGLDNIGVVVVRVIGSAS